MNKSVDYPDESERLAALHDYDILDTQPEPEFDDIAFLASTICKTPVALISLVERQRQWFKAHLGFEACETPIEQSVCAHAIKSSRILVIPDLTEDPRTRANTLVTEAPHIRFYAGAPLITPNGIIIGTLCVIDTAPRPGGLTEDQAKALEALGRQVVMLLEFRRNANRKDALFRKQHALNSRLHALAKSNTAAQEAARLGTFEMDIATGQITASAEFCRIFGVPFAPSFPAAIFEDMVIAEDRDVRSNAESRLAGTAKKSIEFRIRRPFGDIRWIARDATFTMGRDGTATHMHGAVQDITDLREAEEQQQLINGELSHRLKNTFSMVQALASQSLKNVTEQDHVEAFQERVRVLGTAHAILLEQKQKSAPVLGIVQSTLEKTGMGGRIDAGGPDVRFAPKATLTLSLLLHELATNAIKYGSLSNDSGRVAIAWTLSGEDSDPRFHLSWLETGGPPPAESDARGFGSRLIAIGLGNNEASKTFLPTGIHFQASAPLSFLQEAD